MKSASRQLPSTSGLRAHAAAAAWRGALGDMCRQGLRRRGKGLQRCGKGLQRCGKGLQKCGKGLQTCGRRLQRLGIEEWRKGRWTEVGGWEGKEALPFYPPLSFAPHSATFPPHTATRQVERNTVWLDM
eukprot:20475-Chlamydomonas_euryale.AAC.1